MDGAGAIAPAIPRFDYREQYRALRSEILEAIDQVLQSGQLILGPRVKAFEENMCQYLGGVGQAIGVGNGTDALAIALRALKIGPGDEVITVANTAVATVSAIRMAGATPVFCDIDPQTLLINVGDVEPRITSKTKAIIPVHLFGNAVNMVKVERLAARYGLRVIEDCAQSLGTRLHDRLTGTWGDIGCFSFYPTKNLGAYGDGGLCFTRDQELAESIRRIRNYGMDSTGQCHDEGVNSRLDEIQAAILEIKLRHLAESLERRFWIAEAYCQHLSHRCAVPRTTVGASHNHHLFVVQVEKRERICARLRAAGIEYGIHYPTPIHLAGAFRFLGYQAGSLPVTERAAQRVLSLPCYPELPLDLIHEICAVVNDAIVDGSEDLAHEGA